jgi:hypothetical protein
MTGCSTTHTGSMGLQHAVLAAGLLLLDGVKAKPKCRDNAPWANQEAQSKSRNQERATNSCIEEQTI